MSNIKLKTQSSTKNVEEDIRSWLFCSANKGKVVL